MRCITHDLPEIPSWTRRAQPTLLGRGKGSRCLHWPHCGATFKLEPVRGSHRRSAHSHHPRTPPPPRRTTCAAGPSALSCARNPPHPACLQVLTEIEDIVDLPYRADRCWAMVDEDVSNLVPAFEALVVLTGTCENAKQAWQRCARGRGAQAVSAHPRLGCRGRSWARAVPYAQLVCTAACRQLPVPG